MVLREEESVASKCEIKIEVWDKARGQFQIPEAHSKRQMHITKKYRWILDIHYIYNTHYKYNVSDSLFSFFLYKWHLIATEISSGINPVQPGWESVLFYIWTSKLKTYWMCARTEVPHINGYCICFPSLLQLQKWAIMIFIVHDSICQLQDGMNSHNNNWLSLKVINMSR